MTAATRACGKCQEYTALREKAKQEGDYDRAGGYEALRRRHPSHAQPSPTARWGLPA
ncbi:hypothetical protein SBI_05556 [Streptomyces bingchenggensis BCW-1]|uniref:Uncharacterized protein n=1 Tax=Streptomyces bingchenggensis (strain BCW-1) TaxID=749414 RepID=D7CAV9_STRBB|nr:MULTISPECIES: hypothetical protein [Streptomyces]ADI08676.1 hypothetical protein SBI_05556 [Streptomyces bingchenggensis BCW-1]